MMIDHIEKAGKIEKTEEYNIYNVGKSVATKEEEEEWSNMR
ncbi:MAG: hypothetical protein ACJ71R_22950 [Nitrososphaeraceae archaeon]